ncbi:right-handed parallel beta-helix repeat-containing protein [Lentisphaera profundi]|uniref:Right-handed parallel beta-helix repeat-containing protein n=1 Tax=Lentisphaera profundi TaxID=1658616 RepID=A0ABY7VRQ3_9BACT|nr:right-handed parallel beta-helix repeat-containing protein [Lentisphaera profundi]WDE96888.1 right-handed parallel beta-helix repeat-containing protein [Lentisphaera profundi]
MKVLLACALALIFVGGACVYNDIQSQKSEVSQRLGDEDSSTITSDIATSAKSSELVWPFIPGVSELVKAYYISSSKGLDSNDGSIKSPWKSLDKISSIKLEAGDRVCFQKGDRFNGHFVVNGSGTQTQPIIITSYGSGKQAILSGQVGESNGGDFQEAILVENQDNIIFRDLEVHNERLSSREGINDADAYGILILNSGTQVMKNFLFQKVTFKNVYAPKPILKDAGEDAFNGLEVSALTFLTEQNRVAGKEKNIQDVLVEDCYFENLQRLGVHIKHKGSRGKIGNEEINSNKNFVFRNNEFHHTGGTCILPIRTYNCLIENNLFNYPGDSSDPRMPARGSAVWTWHCYNTVIQYNKCQHIRGYLDSHGVHIDHNNHNTFVQYNYMEDCEGGFVEILGGNVNSIYRFNISVNDGWRENPKWKTSNHTLWLNEVVAYGEKQSEQSYIYNNTIYMDRDYSTSIDIDAKNTYVFNNIFYAKQGAIGTKQMNIKDHGSDFVLSHNLYQGFISPRFIKRDAQAIKADPQFYKVRLGSDQGFQLQAGSAAIGAGMVRDVPSVPGAGQGIFKHVPAYPTVDFYGKLLDVSKPSIGASKDK